MTEIYCIAEDFYQAIGLRKFAQPPSAGILFFCPQEEMLFLTHRSNKMKNSPNTWDLPGGRPEDTDKSPIETAIRETYEELGNMPKGKTPIKTHEIKTDKHHYIVYIIPLSSKDKETFTKSLSLSDENNDCRWFKYNEIPNNTHFDLSWCKKELDSIDYLSD